MTAQIIDLTLWQLVLALGLVLIAGGCSCYLRLGLGRDLLVGTVRSVSQLFILGYVLTLVFGHPSVWISLAMFTIMIGSAVHIIKGRVRESEVPVTFPVFISMFLSYLLISVLVTGVIVGAKPWWRPDYFIPLAGMIVGNSMTALSISLERLFADLHARRQEVEMQLCLGASSSEAGRPFARDAIKAGMIPSINSMMGVGIVFIPGMMTGQILSGTDPMVAIRYQIIVMVMLTASTALGSVLVVFLAVKRCFGVGHALVFKNE